MADLAKFTKFFKSMGIDHSLERLNAAEAEELSRMCRVPIAMKSRQYVLVGQTSFHFSPFGQFLGVESVNFEPKEGLEDKDVKGFPSGLTKVDRGDESDKETGDGEGEPADPVHRSETGGSGNGTSEAGGSAPGEGNDSVQEGDGEAGNNEPDSSVSDTGNGD